MKMKKSYWLVAATLILLCSTALAVTTLPPTLSGLHLSNTDTSNSGSCTVENGAKALILVTNDASKVTLTPGFHAKNGSVFRIKISSAFSVVNDENSNTDDDGGPNLVMSDWWEILWFGDLSQKGYEDFDGDGINNYYEFLYGWNPCDALPSGTTTTYEYDAVGRIQSVTVEN